MRLEIFARVFAMTALPSAAAGLRARMAGACRAALSMRNSAQVGKALRGGAWSISGYGVQTALRFISRILLAKLLINAAPLGTVAVVTTILSGLEMISDLGINVSIVQHREGDGTRFLGTARSVQVGRSLVIFLIAAVTAYPIAWMYHDATLAPLLLFAAISVLCRGLSNPGMAVLVRQVDLKRPTIVTICAEIIGFGVTVLWAVRAPSAWALVGGSVASAAATSIGSQFAGRRVPFAWDSAFARNIVHFGGWIILSTGTYFLSSRGEVLMLKGSVPDIEFGCFAFASMLVSAPLTAITQLGSQVMLPFLATWIRADRETAQRKFVRLKWLFTAFGVCFGWGAILVSPVLIRLLHLNRSYATLPWMVQLLGARASFDVFAMPTNNSLLAFGASRYSAIANIIRLIVLTSGLFVTLNVLHLRLDGAIWVLICAPVLAYGSLLPGMSRYLRGTVGVEITTFVVFAASIVAAGALALLMSGVSPVGSLM